MLLRNLDLELCSILVIFSRNPILLVFKATCKFETRTTKNELTVGQRIHVQIYLRSFSDILFLEYLRNQEQQALVKQSKIKQGLYNYISSRVQLLMVCNLLTFELFANKFLQFNNLNAQQLK